MLIGKRLLGFELGKNDKTILSSGRKQAYEINRSVVYFEIKKIKVANEFISMFIISS